MAYIKYKELTKYFYFHKKLEIDTLPKYVMDHIGEKEEIFAAYKTKRDKGVFTDKKILLFDVRGFGHTKQINVIPYKSISTIAIMYKDTTVSLIMYIDSGYPITLKFSQLKPNDKSDLRILYCKMSEKIVNK